MIPNTNPGPYEANVLADSIADGVRLTTLVVTMPRIVLAEFNTHRMLSRNSASSRAIPVEKRIKTVDENPFIPTEFGSNKRGMQAGDALEGEYDKLARKEWLEAKDAAVNHATLLAAAGVHKQLANRLLEPFAWQTIITSGTEWENYWALRISEHAQPEIRIASEAMKAAMDASVPFELKPGEWHLPLVTQADRDIVEIKSLVKLSVARCARVSYLTHGGERDIAADLSLHAKLVGNGHMSPTEHAARVATEEDEDRFVVPSGYGEGSFVPEFLGNFRWPFVQHRKMLAGEAVYGGA